MMKLDFDVEKLLDEGLISNELDYERALIADRSLRLNGKDDPQIKEMRANLRTLIAAYEQKEWNDVEQIDESKLAESDKAEQIAESERLFFEKRKRLIRNKLKELHLTQENLGKLLGHKSKTYISELMSGLKPFTLRDLVMISQLLNIHMNVLVPNFISGEDQEQVMAIIEKLKKPGLSLTRDFHLVFQ